MVGASNGLATASATGRSTAASVGAAAGVATASAVGIDGASSFADAQKTDISPCDGVRDISSVVRIEPTLYHELVLASAPLAYWRLGESSGSVAADSSGNGKSGAYASGTTLGQAGVIGSSTDTAVAFNGAGSVDIASSGFGTVAAFSFEVWCKPDTLATDAALAHRAVIAGSTAATYISQNGNGLGRVLASAQINGVQRTITTANNTLAVGTWAHLVATYDGSSFVLYVNGAQTGTPVTGLSGTVSLGSGTARIGRDNFGGTSGNWFSGTIDEVSVYATALSAADVAARYAARLASFASSAATDIDSVPGVRGISEVAA